eukprot:3296274-Pleurochrysis_carterae.AAC.1
MAASRSRSRSSRSRSRSSNSSISIRIRISIANGISISISTRHARYNGRSVGGTADGRNLGGAAASRRDGAAAGATHEGYVWLAPGQDPAAWTVKGGWSLLPPLLGRVSLPPIGRLPRLTLLHKAHSTSNGGARLADATARGGSISLEHSFREWNTIPAQQQSVLRFSGRKIFHFRIRPALIDTQSKVF